MLFARSNITRSKLLPLLLICAGALSTGCSTPRSEPIAEQKDKPRPLSASPTAAHYGRYTTVNPAVEPGEQDLLLQMVDVSIPAEVTPTVGDALRYILLRSGYRLCTERAEITALDLLPLPAAHLRIGPLQLVDALNVLVGSAWSLEEDGATRTVCFARASNETTVHVRTTETSQVQVDMGTESDSEQRQ